MTSPYSKILWLIEDQKIEPSSLLDFLELSWPILLKKDGFVFLKTNFSEELYTRMIAKDTSPEFWINILVLSEYFRNDETNSLEAALLLKEIWQTKLKVEFPHLEFQVPLLQDHETGEILLTFYQRSDNKQLSEDELLQLLYPHIKENHLEYSPSGPRPGMPRIRKPWIEEIPPE